MSRRAGCFWCVVCGPAPRRGGARARPWPPSARGCARTRAVETVFPIRRLRGTKRPPPRDAQRVGTRSHRADAAPGFEARVRAAGRPVYHSKPGRESWTRTLPPDLYGGDLTPVSAELCILNNAKRHERFVALDSARPAGGSRCADWLRRGRDFNWCRRASASPAVVGSPAPGVGRRASCSGGSSDRTTRKPGQRGFSILVPSVGQTVHPPSISLRRLELSFTRRSGAGSDQRHADVLPHRSFRLTCAAL